MKKNIIYVIAITLPLLGMMGCKQGGNAAADEKKTDSVAAEASTEGTEVPDEEMEGQSGIYDASDVAKYWQQRTIQVTGGKSDIVALFGAFNKEWPTHEGNRIMHQADPASVPDDGFYEEGSIVDRKNGYVESSWFEGEDLSVVTACVWGRKNGHKLFAVNMGKARNDMGEFVCFYDYDPAKKTLTPEESPVKKEHLIFPEKPIELYRLPHEGKVMEVEERGALIFFNAIYTFDGQNLKYVGHDTGWTSQLEEEYRKEDLDDIHYTLTKFALIDIDGDGGEEVWVRTAKDEDGAIFCFGEEGSPSLLITESEGKRPSIGNGWVGIGYPAGGPSYYNHYVTVRNSTKWQEFTDFQVEEKHEYYIGDREIGAAEAQEIKKNIKGKARLIKPRWYKMAK
jgi:hypothetical protein